jgi:hypothetical protein
MQKELRNQHFSVSFYQMDRFYDGFQEEKYRALLLHHLQYTQDNSVNYNNLQ